MDSSRTCCFTGHRDIPARERGRLCRRLKKTVLQLREEGFTDFLTGGALGFDTLAAETVLACRRRHPELRLTVVLPCRDQARFWTPEDRDRYERINAAADEVICLAEAYDRGCMHRRDRYLADHSAVCVCYLTRDTGGTAYTVGYARSRGLRVCNLAEDVCP